METTQLNTADHPSASRYSNITEHNNNRKSKKKIAIVKNLN